MRRNNKIAGYVYFIQGGVNPKTIFLKALAVIIAQKQHEGKNVINKFEELRNAYHEEYHVSLPVKSIKSLIEENFDIVHEKYEFKQQLELRIDSIADEIKKEKLRFDEKLNELKGKFSEYYKGLSPNSNKQQINEYFQRCIMKEPDRNSEYDVEDGESSDTDIRLGFLRQLLESRDDLYDIVENLTIADAITNIPVDAYYDFSYKNCEFYLDTPILMKYLGYDGFEYRNLYKDVITSLKEFGVTFCVFEHTVEEIWGILFQWKIALEKNNFLAKGLDTYLQARKYYKNDSDILIPLERDGLLASIDRAGLKIGIKPELSKNNVVYAEKAIIALFENKYRTTYNSFPDRINKDVDSITGIQSLRLAEGITNPGSHENAKFFIMTDNKSYFDIANENYRRYHSEVPTGKALCEVQYSDYVILNLWQKEGKRVLPKQLFKARVLTSDSITKEFRQEFLILLNRMTNLGDFDLTRMMNDNPDVLQKAAMFYNASNHSVEGLIKFLKSEWEQINARQVNETESYIRQDTENIAKNGVANEKSEGSFAAIDINEIQKRETAVHKREEAVEQKSIELSKIQEDLAERERIIREREAQLQNRSIFKILWQFIKHLLRLDRKSKTEITNKNPHSI